MHIVRDAAFLWVVAGCGLGGDNDTALTAEESNSVPMTSAPDTGDTSATTSVPQTDTGSSSTTDVTGGSSSDPTSGPVGTSTDPVGSTFIVGTDVPNAGVECDVFAQDCPDGQKCSAYAQGGGTSWNATKCVPVTGDKQAGDACTVEGNGVSGIDDCAEGVMCWDTNAENVGYCVALCTGTIDSPVCESGFTCAVVNDGVLNLCLDSCDPLSQDCEMADDLCIPTGDGFLCVLDASGEEGQQHDPCEYANSCDPGHACMDATAATECDPNAGGCCQPFCDLSEPDPDAQCTGMGQKCEPWFEMGMAPPDYVNVGICVIPA